MAYEKRKREPLDPKLVSEMRRLRGLNKSFEEIAAALNKQGFTTSSGTPLSVQTIAYLFKKTADMDLGDLNPKAATQDLIDVVLRGPLQPDIKVGLISKIQSGEITDLNYKKIDIPQSGGRVFEQGNYANPANKVAVTLGGEKLKSQCRLLVHFWDEIKKIADS